MTLFMMSNIMLSLMLIFLKHPISMGSTLLIQTTIVSLILGNLNLNFWFSYILFIVMVGGMLVLFIYMTSIASNEQFSKKLMKLVPLMIGMLIMSPFILNKLNYTFNLNMKNEEFLVLNNHLEFQQILNKFIMYPSMLIFMFMVIYLLITMIAIVKITKLSYGPLRQFN
uniref:NADH-ubiquinone oxidoreductase chain 6 n=1 Tax=Tenebrionoidea sp. 23 KM-2017 TaxID=2219479 RepID=A0A346RJA1_9CUCU|nr:NADH dehydrogenase subunit 6 [Tenebrionoidea sp. 23 KM-2017]